MRVKLITKHPKNKTTFLLDESRKAKENSQSSDRI